MKKSIILGIIFLFLVACSTVKTYTRDDDKIGYTNSENIEFFEGGYNDKLDTSYYYICKDEYTMINAESEKAIACENDGIYYEYFYNKEIDKIITVSFKSKDRKEVAEELAKMTGIDLDSILKLNHNDNVKIDGYNIFYGEHKGFFNYGVGLDSVLD